MGIAWLAFINGFLPLKNSHLAKHSCTTHAPFYIQNKCRIEWFGAAEQNMEERGNYGGQQQRKERRRRKRKVEDAERERKAYDVL